MATILSKFYISVIDQIFVKYHSELYSYIFGRYPTSLKWNLRTLFFSHLSHSASCQIWPNFIKILHFPFYPNFREISAQNLTATSLEDIPPVKQGIWELFFPIFFTYRVLSNLAKFYQNFTFLFLSKFYWNITSETYSYIFGRYRPSFTRNLRTLFFSYFSHTASCQILPNFIKTLHFHFYPNFTEISHQKLTASSLEDIAPVLQWI